jgi:hypothetical protein
VLVEELYSFVDNHYIDESRDNTQVVSLPCGNNPMKVDVLYDDIDDEYRPAAEGS